MIHLLFIVFRYLFILSIVNNKFVKLLHLKYSHPLQLFMISKANSVQQIRLQLSSDYDEIRIFFVD